jgi:hypothetical protein
MDFSDDDLANIVSMLPPARGRQAVPCTPLAVRPITQSDIADLLNPSTLGATTPQIKRLRTQHHHLAKLLAQGEKAVAVSAITGYSQSRISILQNDPAFQELITYYKSQADQMFLDVHAKLAGLGEAIVEELQERLESDPDEIPINTLLRMGEFALDRSSAPPKSKTNSGPVALPSIKISFHKGSESEQLTIEAAPQGEGDDFL